jgi:hypothetical protein
MSIEVKYFYFSHGRQRHRSTDQIILCGHVDINVTLSSIDIHLRKNMDIIVFYLLGTNGVKY